MAKKFTDLKKRLPPARQAKIERMTAELHAALPLHQLRQALKYSQGQVAEEMGITQAAVSQIENRDDVLINTLRRFIEAMGGTLEVRARFPAGEVTLEDLSSKPT